MRLHGKKLEDFLLYMMTLALAGIFLFAGHRVAVGRLPRLDGDSAVPVAANVLEITGRESESYDLGSNGTAQSVYVTFTARIVSGESKGQTVTALQTLDYLMAGTMEEVSAGDRILLYYEEEAFREQHWMMGEYRRTDALMVLLAVFAGVLLLLGRAKGFHTLVSLTLTVAAVFAVFLPSVLSGYNIYLWASGTCLFVVVVTLLLVSGFSVKTLCAALGCAGGLAACGLIASGMSGILRLTGIIDQETAYLSQVNQLHPLDMRGIVFAGILIGAMGAVMDVGLSLASALWELRRKGKDPTAASLLASGLSIGRDMLGTMSNTLILAYIGSSLATVLLLAAYQSAPLGLLNREMVAIELLQMLVGSLGILLTVPASSLACALLYPRAGLEASEEAGL